MNHSRFGFAGHDKLENYAFVSPCLNCAMRYMMIMMNGRSLFIHAIINNTFLMSKGVMLPVCI